MAQNNPTTMPPQRTPHPSVLARRAARTAAFETERARVLRAMSYYRLRHGVALHRLTCVRADFWRLHGLRATSASAMMRCRQIYRTIHVYRRELAWNARALAALDRHLKDIVMREEDAVEGAEVADFLNGLFG